MPTLFRDDYEQTWVRAFAFLFEWKECRIGEWISGFHRHISDQDVPMDMELRLDLVYSKSAIWWIAYSLTMCAMLDYSEPKHDLINRIVTLIRGDRGGKRTPISQFTDDQWSLAASRLQAFMTEFDTDIETARASNLQFWSEPQIKAQVDALRARGLI